MRILLPALAVLGMVGCGFVAEPLPPLANVPSSVQDLAVVQRGNRLVAQFTVPKLTTEALTIKSRLTLDLRIGPPVNPLNADAWAESAAPVPEAPVSKGIAIYEIPASAWTGKQAVVGVRVTGTNDKSSSWSNLILVPVVPQPPVPADVRAEATANGVRLSWRAAGANFRIFRRVGDATFVAVADTTESPWTDASSEFGKSYAYRVETIVKLDAGREAESDPSAPVSITPEDRFPPAVPSGLRATPTPTSVEISWEGDTDADLAGYRVYRSSAGGPFEKIADTSTVPSYSDHSVEHGKTYRYAITAFDQSGNESARSAPAEATLE